MNSYIKNFIENNISLIEENKWAKIFINWYNSAEDVWPDEDVFKEFIQIMMDAGITPDWDTRQDLIYSEILYYMEKLKDENFNANNHIGRATIAYKLHSALGYTEKELYKMMDDAAKELNLKFTLFYGGGYTW